MSETEQILDEFVESQGWSDRTVLDLALTYIDNQENHADWRDYLESLKAVDDEMDDAAIEDVVDDWAANPASPAATIQSNVVVHFQPEAWIDDHAVAVDTDWDQDTWRVSFETANAIIQARTEHGDGDLDFVREDHFALQWCKDWSGPFTISVVHDD